MRNIVPMIYAIILLVCQTACFHQSSGNKGRSYYLDATYGDDSNTGKTPKQAWKTLQKINTLSLSAGDKVLLKRGEIFRGVLELSGQGTAQDRIYIDAYGDEAALPCISGEGMAPYAVRIYNSSYVTLQNVEIVNTGTQPAAGRTGLKIECNDYGVSKHLVVNHVKVRDVNGSLIKGKGEGSGIQIQNTGKEIVSVFDSLTIENCHITRCARNGITFWEVYYDRNNWHPNKHTVIRHNLIEGVPGDGIVPIGCDSTLIEYNVMRACPATLPMSEAAAGFWPWSCDNTIIRFNEVSGHKAPWDAQAYDCDYNCTNTVIEYNYSHDNYGGMVLVCNSGGETGYSIGNRNSIVRYNISINDGIRPVPSRNGKMFSPSIHLGGPTKNTIIERNIIHVGSRDNKEIDRSMIVADSWEGYPDSTLFQGNLFYAADDSRIVLTQSINNRFKGNFFLGKYQSLPKDEAMKENCGIYQTEIVDSDPNGFKGLQQLMNPRLVGGEVHYAVDKKKIEEFFERINN